MYKFLTKLELFHPKLWPAWVGFGLLRIIAFLPFQSLMMLGKIIGFLIKNIAKRRVNIARINLKKCFPKYEDGQIERLLNDHLYSIGMGVMDFIISWWWSNRRIDKYLEIK